MISAPAYHIPALRPRIGMGVIGCSVWWNAIRNGSLGEDHDFVSDGGSIVPPYRVRVAPYFGSLMK